MKYCPSSISLIYVLYFGGKRNYNLIFNDVAGASDFLGSKSLICTSSIRLTVKNYLNFLFKPILPFGTYAVN